MAPSLESSYDRGARLAGVSPIVRDGELEEVPAGEFVVNAKET
jgi:hypothetical protein